MFLFLLTSVVLSGGLYYTFYLHQLNEIVIGTTIIASWWMGYHVGEFIEKIQGWFHWWSIQEGKDK